ncbi:YbhB/YbcL family Raf kinase inhibitor-like protein [Embleya scabrispora]|uniref:YbhB/YbcL family Raf kinase inhibitor-like protein n=1 Tax=Embleya scabrispora TaxID=159449 RepID=UPI0004783CB2|nr:YbhB/YbcL family Raf kinase inhibitor-like protein [Embleya scabrispora]MYS87439.1 YbhB/YbcL family Raf kinase inhibitor-like protein [Streptomyces sp. SID5474]
MTSPYDPLPAVPEFVVTSADVTDGAPLAPAQFAAMSGAAGAEDRSPQLSWTGFPAATRSFVVTMYDPDAPTPSGFWHWAVADIAADVTSLDAGAGTPDSGGLPVGAFHVSNDVRATAYVGAAPPPGTGRHRYYIAVTALDVPSVTALGVTPESTPAALGFLTLQHTLARALLVPWAGE